MGFFFKRKTSEIKEIGKTSRIESDTPFLSFQVEALQGLGCRKEQQDAYAAANTRDVAELRKNGMFVAVADGMGGMSGGQFASRTVASTLQTEFKQSGGTDNIAELLRQSVFHANDAVYEELEGRGGSTVVAAVFFDNKLFTVSVGDSGLYLFRSGELTRLNRVHNCLHQNYLEIIRSDSMDPTAANENPEKAPLTQYAGVGELQDIDGLKRPLPLKEGDVILLCSDGVDGVLEEETMKYCLQGSTAKEICERFDKKIVAAANPHQDNYTAIVVKCIY